MDPWAVRRKAWDALAWRSAKAVACVHKAAGEARLAYVAAYNYLTDAVLLRHRTAARLVALHGPGQRKEVLFDQGAWWWLALLHGLRAGLGIDIWPLLHRVERHAPPRNVRGGRSALYEASWGKGGRRVVLMGRRPAPVHGAPPPRAPKVLSAYAEAEAGPDPPVCITEFVRERVACLTPAGAFTADEVLAAAGLRGEGWRVVVVTEPAQCGEAFYDIEEHWFGGKDVVAFPT